MYLKTLYVRFYKSFNDDFLRKNDQRYKPKPWEKIGDNSSYPYIEVPIEEKITTIVGANESGKSHLLSAIKKAITGKEIERSDFCRYSAFFTVKTNQLKYPDFGTEWTNLSENEQKKLVEIINPTETLNFNSFKIFRTNKDDLTIYLPFGDKYRPYTINLSDAENLQNLLPKILEIKSNIALPTSVPIQALANLGREECSTGDHFYSLDDLNFNPRNFEFCTSEERHQILDLVNMLENSEIVESFKDYSRNKQTSFTKEFIEVGQKIQSILKNNDSRLKENKANYQLAYKLICKIAQVDPRVLSDLSKAIREGKHGYANGIIEKINRQLSSNLNFPSYWVQDKEFRLKVMARDYDLVFTITDRTGTDY